MFSVQGQTRSPGRPWDARTHRMAWTCGTEGKSKIHMEQTAQNHNLKRRIVLGNLSTAACRRLGSCSTARILCASPLSYTALQSLGLGYSTFSPDPVALLMWIKHVQGKLKINTMRTHWCLTGVSQSHKSVFLNWLPSLWLFFMRIPLPEDVLSSCDQRENTSPMSRERDDKPWEWLIISLKFIPIQTNINSCYFY